MVTADHVLIACNSKSHEQLWQPLQASELRSQQHKLLSSDLQPIAIESSVPEVRLCEVVEVELAAARDMLFVSDDGGNCPFVAVFGVQRQRFSSDERVRVLTFSRCPKSFDHALLEGEILRTCRHELAKAGWSAELRSGAKMFVHPGMVRYVLNALRFAGFKLRGRHVICSREFEPLVLRSIARASRGGGRNHISLKAISNLAEVSDTSDFYRPEDLTSSMAGEVVIIVRRTFLDRVVVPGAATASTSDVHIGAYKNPRKLLNGCEP